MTTLTIRALDAEVKAALRRRAADHGRSMEAEAREILAAAVRHGQEDEQGLGTRIHQDFAEIGGVVLDIPARVDLPRAPELPG